MPGTDCHAVHLLPGMWMPGSCRCQGPVDAGGLLRLAPPYCCTAAGTWHLLLLAPSDACLLCVRQAPNGPFSVFAQ